MRLDTLQYLRAIAALAVVYSHTVIQVDAYHALLPEFGSFGVDIFFVISGFIMVYIARPNDTPGRFMVNRIRRVVPLYWFFTLLLAAILLVAPGLFNSTTLDGQTLAQSLLFWPAYSPANPPHVWPLLAPGWSLNYEMFFYLTFAVSLWLPFARRLPFITAVIVMVWLLATLLHDGAAVTAFYGNGIILEFAFGMGLARAWQLGFRLPPLAGWALLLAGSVGLFLHLPVPRIAEYGIPALLIVTGTLFIQLPTNKLGVLLGDASYALYLSHIFTLGVLRKIVPPFLGDGLGSALAFVALSLLTCLVVSVFVHRYIDNWLLRRERLMLAWSRQESPINPKKV